MRVLYAILDRHSRVMESGELEATDKVDAKKQVIKILQNTQGAARYTYEEVE